jgi:hypothetical protein
MDSRFRGNDGNVDGGNRVKAIGTRAIGMKAIAMKANGAPANGTTPYGK